MAAALDEGVRRDLEQALHIHGWPCSAVESYRSLGEGQFDVGCAEGQRYRLTLRPGWNFRAGERQTGLHSLLEIAALVRSLEGGDAASRRSAALRLGELGPTAGPAVPRLIGALRDEDRLVRRNVARALGRIGSVEPEPLAALIEALGDPDREVRAAAVTSLGELGPEARDAVPALEETLRGDDPRLRNLAADALASIAAPSPGHRTGGSASP